MLPNVVIIGAQKSATTFVQRAFEDHPQAVALQGEIKTFEDPEFSPEALSRLSERLASSGEKCARVIKRAEYLGRSEVAVRLHEHLPEAKIIVVLRNPIERFLSAYYHHIRYGNLPVVSHEEGIPRVLDGSWREKFPLSQSLLEYGLYAKYLADYKELFEEDRLLVLLHHDILACSESALRRIYSFTGIDPEHRTANLKRRSQAALYSLPRLKFLSMRNRFCLRRNKSGLRKPMGSLAKMLWYFTEGFDRYIIGKFISNPRPTVSDSVAHQLGEYYAPDIARLEQMLTLDLSDWKPSKAG